MLRLGSTSRRKRLKAIHAAMLLATLGAVAVAGAYLTLKQGFGDPERVSEAPMPAQAAPQPGPPTEPVSARTATPQNADDDRLDPAVAQSARPLLAPPSSPPLRPATAGLIVDGKLVPGKAFQLLDTEFDALLADLSRESERDAASAELEQLYMDQIVEILAGSDVSVRRLECGLRVCAAELFRARGANRADPFADAQRFEDRLPRQARVELSFLDDERNALRRFIFSVDPAVTSLDTPRR
jgi:hypothetical protein